MMFTAVVALLNRCMCSLYLSLCQTVSRDFGCSYVELKDVLYVAPQGTNAATLAPTLAPTGSSITNQKEHYIPI